MKIDKQVRDAFDEQTKLNAQLKLEVDQIETALDPGWHYESRLKAEESFALKVEAGRFNGGLVIEDFLGCLIVVRNTAEIGNALTIVHDNFEVLYRRPKDDIKTKKRPTDFSFDDLRLYAKMRSVDYLPRKAFADVIFEVQIKTYLQHAWGIATHDLTYKTDAVSWAKTRIAHQVRAMLEHAELSIEQVDRLTGSMVVAKENDEYLALTRMIDMLKEFWPKEQLPKDLLRLARNASAAIGALNISIPELVSELRAETDSGRGAKLENLSPYGAIMQTIVNRFAARISGAGGKIKGRVPISKQVELPGELEGEKSSVFVLI